MVDKSSTAPGVCAGMKENNAAANFRIRKHYMDCVDNAGNGCIMYHAHVRWGRLAFTYVGDLCFTSHSHPGTRSKLAGVPPPDFETGTRNVLSWNCAPLEDSGSWTSKRAVISERLLSSDEGEVNWTCLQPLAHAEVNCAGKTRLNGTGYSECLDLTIKPWRLPIEQLRWGRFLAENESIVWIEWRGPHPLKLVYRNGRQVAGVQIDEQSVRAASEGWELHFTETLTLRDGALLSTVFDKIPLIKQSFPMKMLNARESKWRSRAELRIDSAPPVSGWSIHELVQWR